MKNYLKRFGIIAAFALIVFSAAACKDTDDLTYTIVLMKVNTQAHYEEVFDALFVDPQNFKLLEGSRGDLIDKVNKAINNSNFTVGKNVTGLSYDAAKNTIYAGKPQNGLQEGDNLFVVNELLSRGYCVGVKKLGGGAIGIAAAYSD